MRSTTRPRLDEVHMEFRRIHAIRFVQLLSKGDLETEKVVETVTKDRTIPDLPKHLTLFYLGDGESQFHFYPGPRHTGFLTDVNFFHM